MLKVLIMRWRLLCLFITMVCTVFATVFYIGRGLAASEVAISHLNQVRLPAIRGLQAIEQGRLESTRAEQDVLMFERDNPTLARFDAAAEARRRAWVAIRKGWVLYERVPRTPAMTIAWNRFLVDWKAWSALSDSMGTTIDTLRRNTGMQKQKALFVTLSRDYTASLPLAAALDQSLSRLRQLSRAELEAAFAARSAALSYARSAVLALVVMLLICGAAAILWLWLWRRRVGSAPARLSCPAGVGQQRAVIPR